MNQPIVFRKNLSIAIVRVLQNTLPAVVVAGTLCLLVWITGVPFDRMYATLAATAGLLSLLILRPTAEEGLSVQVPRTEIGMEILVRWTLILGVLLGLGYIAGFSDYYARRAILPWMFITPALLLWLALALRHLMRRVVLSQENLRSAIVVGANDAGFTLAKRLADNPELCTRVQGFFDDRSAERLGLDGGFSLIGRLSEVADYVRDNSIDVIYVSLPIRHIKRVVDLLDELRDSTASLYYVPDVFVFDLIQSRTTDIRGIPVVALCETPFFGFRGALKRLTDILFTIAIMVPALPLMTLIAILIKVTSKGPAIFRQRRYGLDGREITVYKFRSMYVTEDGPHVPQAQRDDPRITPLGRILRRSSLDELPQLINVLQGRMSLVGPRPHAVAHNEQYRHLIKGYMMRHKVLPGVTGLAQVNGCRGETSELSQMEARVKYDLDYLRHWSPVMDVKIILRTIIQVFRDTKAY